ncbi:hypothetical protein PHYPO_G00005750 [Pangasianodon hypophthalmus]|uniref:Uncharacterized protein n=1 Tax=Pangasianodon hypophthalmus TaxID=310915 RepID=A0A5N5Q6B5_PANHP|nr:hypothetical protein PHYPO_G00005750 [Pangasianodon hypophthalmus]
MKNNFLRFFLRVQRTEVDLQLRFLSHTRFTVDFRGIKGPAVHTYRAKRIVRDPLLLLLWPTFPALTDR